jgi:hypothetical protein
MSGASKSLRQAVRRRALGFREYCRSRSELTGHEFTLDHIIPSSAGGKSRFQDLCWFCFWCNNYKQARTQAVDPKTSRLVPLFNPRGNQWETHFKWSRDGTRIIGRSPIGRATIKALRLNRPFLVQARRIWTRHGLHPPEITAPRSE